MIFSSMTVAFTIIIYPLFNFAIVDSTKALQEQALAVDGPKGDQVDSIELKRLKDDMTSMKKKIMGKSVYFELPEPQDLLSVTEHVLLLVIGINLL